MDIFKNLLGPSTGATPSKGLLGDPQSQMMLGASLLAAGGPSLTPKSGFEGVPQTMALMQRQQMLKQEQERQNQEREAQREAIAGLGLNADLPGNLLAAQYNSKFAKPEAVDSFSIKSAQDLGMQGEGFFNVNNRTGKVTQIGGGGVSVTNNMPGENKYMMEEYSTMSKDGRGAQARINNLSRLGALLNNIDTGGGAALKEMAGNYGIRTEGLGNIQAARSLITQMAMDFREPGTGPMTDQDFQKFEDIMPSLLGTERGNRIIVNTLTNMAQHKVKVGEIGRSVLLGQRTPDQAEKMLLELPNPFEEFNKSLNSGSEFEYGSDEDLSHRYNLGG